MKKLFTFLFLVLVCGHVIAQKNTFVRVYNLQGMKVNSGRVVAATDSSLQLKAKRNEVINLPIKTIGAIKVGRTAGHNVLIGAFSGGVILGLIVGIDASKTEPSAFTIFTPALSGLIGGIVFGLPAGAAAGGLSALFKKSNIFIIDGNMEKWKEFQSFIEVKKELINNR